MLDLAWWSFVLPWYIRDIVKLFRITDQHPVVHIPDNSIQVRGDEPAGELDGVVQLEAPDLVV
jgi:hypothetical protein